MKRKIGQAKALRKKLSPAESKLWKELRRHALAGFKFRRQHAIGPYIIDFACSSVRLAIELDGPSHLASVPKDGERAEYLTQAGWKVLRFWNTDVFENFEAVLNKIYEECLARAKEIEGSSGVNAPSP